MPVKAIRKLAGVSMETFRFYSRRCRYKLIYEAHRPSKDKRECGHSAALIHADIGIAPKQ